MVPPGRARRAANRTDYLRDTHRSGAALKRLAISASLKGNALRETTLRVQPKASPYLQRGQDAIGFGLNEVFQMRDQHRTLHGGGGGETSGPNGPSRGIWWLFVGFGFFYPWAKSKNP
jgi:hypothetical protein